MKLTVTHRKQFIIADYIALTYIRKKNHFIIVIFLHVLSVWLLLNIFYIPTDIYLDAP